MAGTDTGLKFLKRQANKLSRGEMRDAGKITSDEATQSEGAQAMWRASHALSDTPEDAKASKNLRENMRERDREARGMKKGGAVTAKRRGDGIAQRGKTKGRMV